MRRRRAFLLLAGASLAGLARAQLPPKTAARRKAALDEAIRGITAGAVPQSGRVKIDILPLIDNGNSVPVAVTVESPMTPADHVTAIHLFTEMNPQPRIASAFFGPRAGRAYLATRARIADSGTITALARTSDGAFWIARVDVVVTLPACVEESPI